MTAEAVQTFDAMNSQPNEDGDPATGERARRVQLIIYLLMLAGMALPFIVAWYTGHLGFSETP